MATTCQAGVAAVILVALSVVVASALAAGPDDLSRASHVVRGTVSCIDCHDNAAGHQYHLSGIMVSVKCGGGKQGTVATTKEDGSFETTTSHNSQPPESGGCHAKILGGAHQLYVPKETSSEAAKTTAEPPAGHGGLSYTIVEPLRFYTRCPNKKCEAAAGSEFGSSKPIDLPDPSEWGLAPTNYYLPFIPIIGIP
ncbi:unnamed protein product [Cuscuta campestris]|uniref:Pollen Ole e 1 allergen and extensin family protein n=2 Tax=Cuscuta sect. Cleistogrammica TaxID=1824901 RepID=A0A484N260_9ASTE|nr:hypothetical protein DM860_006145 [Cuscuta australis]VFQ95385.1 unnamed protein product [Cuscuta campestris]